MGQGETATASLSSFPGALAPEPPYLVILSIIHGEAAPQSEREFLEPLGGIGIGSVVFKAHVLLNYVFHQKKCLLKVANGIILEYRRQNLGPGSGGLGIQASYGRTATLGTWRAAARPPSCACQGEHTTLVLSMIPVACLLFFFFESTITES